MFKLFGETEYLIRIHYKSGAVEDFWCTKFIVNPDGSLKWTTAKPKRPIKMAAEVSEIESIWQLEHKVPLFGEQT